MKLQLHHILGVWLFAGLASLQASKIIWVVQEDGPGGIEFIEMLQTEGHEVEVMVVAGAPPTQEQQDTMNAADLVVVSRKVNSGDAAYNTFVWNDTITTPLISHSPYILRTNTTERWQWMDGDGLADSVPSTVEANEPTHKLFEGIAITDGISPEWHFALHRNTSVSTNGVAKGGKAIATKTADPESAIIAAEWETGQVAVGPRMMLMVGAREPNPSLGLGLDYGQFNLTEVGQIVYLNSISYYAGPWGSAHLWATFAKDLGEVDSAPGGQDTTILVKNLGLDAPVNITNLSFTGTAKDFYTVKSAPESIAPTEVAEIVITLDPNGNTGAFDAELVIESDSTMESIRTRTVALSARALNFAGPAAHYALNETSGEEILDVTGNGRHAAASGAVDLTAGSLVGGDGTAAAFSGGQVTADLTELGIFADFSVAFWMNANEGGDDLQTIVAKDSGASPTFGLLRAGNNFQWFVGEGAKYETSDNPIVPGSATHVAVIYNKTDNETLTLYVNGTQIAQEAGLEPFDDSAESPFLIGSFNGTFSFNGILDDVQIYTRLLDEEEVTAMFNDPGSFPRGGPPVVEPPTGGIGGLLGYWRLDESEGNVAADNSGNGNDGNVVQPDGAWVNDPTRGKVYQSGNGSFIDLGVLPVIGLDSDFTWSFWVNAGQTSNNNIVLGNRYMPDGNDFAPREFVKFTPTKFEWHFNAVGENAPDTPLVVGQWDHNIVVKDGSSLTYYRNGEVVAEQTITGAPTNSLPLYLGGQPNNAGAVAENFVGLFDEVAVFSRALSAQEASQAYQLGLAGQPLDALVDPGPNGGLPSLTNVSQDADGNFSLTLPEGETANVEYSQDLISWEVIGNGISGPYQDTDATRKARSAGYYRAAQ